MKTTVLALFLTSAAMADAIRFTGIVTETEGGAPVNVGATFEAWFAFHIQDVATLESWTPGALEFSCSMSQCITSLSSDYRMYLGSRGIVYNNGVSFRWPDFGGDQSSGSMDSDLHVNWAATSGGGLLFISPPMNLFSHDVYYMEAYRSVRGAVLGAEYTAAPEPSTLLPVGLALFSLPFARLVRRRTHL